jgi:peptidoglycan/LPS O-acetylase OafA/YrhL
VNSFASEADSKRFAHIDFMRAVAVLLVLLQHAGLEKGLLGSAGVTMFFVISGFVITNLALVEAAVTGRFAIGDFYLRRAIKLLPPLVAVVVLPSLVLGFASNWTKVNPSSLLSQVLFFYNTVRIHGQQGVLPGADVVWSLSVEEQFYIGFALLWLVCLKLPQTRLALSWLAGLAIVCSTILRFSLAHSGHQELAQRIYFSTETRIDAIAIGVLLAVFLKSEFWRTVRARVSSLIWDGLLFACVAVLSFSLLLGDYVANYSWLISLHALCSAGILLVGFSGGTGLLVRGLARVSNLSAFKVIGLASYSIYLVHHTVSLALSSMVVDLPPLLGIVIKVLAGLVVGVLTWLAVERPVERLKAQLMKREWRGAVTVG